MQNKITPRNLWISLFAIWVLFLSGAFANLFGGPGVIQAFRLQRVLNAKQAQIKEYRTQIARLESESAQLDKSRVVQQREIRHVLGYAASDEIIFDFTPKDRVQ